MQPGAVLLGRSGPRRHPLLGAQSASPSRGNPELARLGDAGGLLAGSGSCGFWPGGGPIPYAAFYSYAYPEPAGFAQARVEPGAAFYTPELREFILPYDAVRLSERPDETLLEFLQSTYEAAAELGQWDRAALERGEDPRDAT
jgi:Family of unknown function (DUF5996)